VLAAMASAGAGHGDYLWAKIFFPFTMISSLLYQTNNAPQAVNVLLWIVLPIIQYPVYGVILALASQKAKTSIAAIGLCALHVIVAALNFVIQNPNFS
jgi:hypothetical protein